MQSANHPPVSAAEKLSDPSTDVNDSLNEINELVTQAQGEADSLSLNSDLASSLVSARLGIAAGLFESIQMKHAPSALHSLRVALGCSVWFDQLDSELQGSGLKRDDLEIAALLHDLGKIGVPDQILTKPSFLNADEREVVDRQRRKGLEVLSSFCNSDQVVEIVEHSATWFDGSRSQNGPSGKDLPLGARMLSIIDAFDSMTTNQVYRKALSIDRAVVELLDNAGTQFDPDLVRSFSEVISKNWFDLQLSCCRRWAEGKQKNTSVVFTVASNQFAREKTSAATDALSPFRDTLFGQMLDGVFFVDRQSKILFWNPAVERITGLSSGCVLERRFSPSLIDLQNETATIEIPDNECPIQKAMAISEPVFRRFSLRGRTEERHTVEMQISPVVGTSGESLGATVVVHDSSNTCTLEERVESLYSRASQDPLTRVANRSEFDRVHAEFVDQHLQENTPCSLIICDLDFFKKINDDYGHQAGDEALIAFASILKRFHRVGDLVARYGGEEFVLLCAGCDNTTATERAEEIRNVLQNTPLEVLDNKCLRASFGVTEVQKGDSPELMLRRADRALIMAKENGRNRVVQLGIGMESEAVPTMEEQPAGGFFDWFRRKSVEPQQPVSQSSLISQVPIELAIQKLRGFVMDQDAQIIEIEENDISIKVSGQNPNFGKRSSDRPLPFHVLLQFSSIEDTDPKKRSTRTRIKVLVSPIRSRDRRKNDLGQRANLIINSLKSYLMASLEEDPKAKTGLIEPAATESGRD